MSTVHSILLVEDDVALAREIVIQCEEFGLTVEHLADGEAGFKQALAKDYMLLVLDVKLPGMNGLDFCREIKAAKPALPVILLTSKDKEIDRVLGFELGADDYVTKPFHMSELVARIRAKLRFISSIRGDVVEKNSPAEALELTIGDIQVLPAQRIAKKAGAPLDLSAKEFDLLLFLMRQKDRVFTKHELLSSVWQLEVSGYEDAVVSLAP